MTRSSTHEVRIDRTRGLVVKRFRSADRGEPVREWAALSLLARFAPGLAPAPVSADLTGDPPALTMSLLPGAQLSAAPVTPAQACALAAALERLAHADDQAVLGHGDPCMANFLRDGSQVRLVDSRIAARATVPSSSPS